MSKLGWFLGGALAGITGIAAAAMICNRDADGFPASSGSYSKAQEEESLEYHAEEESTPVPADGTEDINSENNSSQKIVLKWLEPLIPKA